MKFSSAGCKIISNELQDITYSKEIISFSMSKLSTIFLKMTFFWKQDKTFFHCLNNNLLKNMKIEYVKEWISNSNLEYFMLKTL